MLTGVTLIHFWSWDFSISCVCFFPGASSLQTLWAVISLLPCDTLDTHRLWQVLDISLSAEPTDNISLGEKTAYKHRYINSHTSHFCMKKACKYTLNPAKVSWTFYLKDYLGLYYYYKFISFVLTLKSFNNMVQIFLDSFFLKKKDFILSDIFNSIYLTSIAFKVVFSEYILSFFSVASRHIFTVLCRWDTYERPVVSCSRHSSNTLCLGQWAPDLQKCLMSFATLFEVNSVIFPLYKSFTNK